MKLLRDLTVEDLHTTPVWKFFGGSDEDALVEPTSRSTLSEAEHETYIAVTEFVLANGQKYFGFCSPVDDSGLDYVQPVIVTGQGHICLWFDEPPARDVLVEQWTRLGALESQVFPIRYNCLVPVNGANGQRKDSQCRERGQCGLTRRSSGTAAKARQPLNFTLEPYAFEDC